MKRHPPQSHHVLAELVAVHELPDGTRAEVVVPLTKRAPCCAARDDDPSWDGKCRALKPGSRHCAGCGRGFEPKSNAQRTCSADCARARKTNKQRVARVRVASPVIRATPRVAEANRKTPKGKAAAAYDHLPSWQRACCERADEWDRKNPRPAKIVDGVAFVDWAPFFS